MHDRELLANIMDNLDYFMERLFDENEMLRLQVEQLKDELRELYAERDLGTRYADERDSYPHFDGYDDGLDDYDYSSAGAEDNRFDGYRPPFNFGIGGTD